MKTNIILLLVSFAGLVSANNSNAQISRINETISRPEAESHLRFLTADELRGRDTGTPELLIAGRYIAEQFRRFGLIPIGDTEGGYLQRVPLHTTRPPAEATVSMLGQEFTGGVDLCVLSGDNGTIEAPLVYLTELKDYDPASVKGKVVITVLQDLRGSAISRDQVKALEDAGAVALIQLFGPAQRIPWQLVLNYLNRERMSVGEIDENEEEGLPHL